MTIATSCFYYRKKQGKIRKGPMAVFCDGTVRCERRLWVDTENGEMTVMLNGDAHTFTPWRFHKSADEYSWSPKEEDDYIGGHI